MSWTAEEKLSDKIKSRENKCEIKRKESEEMKQISNAQKKLMKKKSVHEQFQFININIHQFICWLKISIQLLERRRNTQSPDSSKNIQDPGF